MKFKKLLLVLILMLFLGCASHPSKVSKGRAKRLTTKITYVFDQKTGLCFAVVSSRNRWAGIIPMMQNGLGLTQVPCEACREFIEE